MAKFSAPPWADSVQLTKATYSSWFSRIYNIAISRFQWDNIPKEDKFFDQRFIEQIMFWNGIAVGFEDEILGRVVLPAIPSSNFDVLGNPKLMNAYSYTGDYTRYDLSSENSCVLYNNWGRNADVKIITLFAKRLTEIDRTIDLNLAAQKRPRIAIADDTQRLTVKNMIKHIDSYEPWLYATKDSNIREMFNVLDLSAPYLADKLQMLKRSTWTECLTYLGIEANASEKAERQLAGEIELTLGQTEAMRYSPLCSREDFCERFNEKFGTNISVKMRSNLQLSVAMQNDEASIPPESIALQTGK